MNGLPVSLLLGCLLLLQGAAGQRLIRRDSDDAKEFASVAVGPRGELFDEGEELEEPSAELLDNSEEADPDDDDGDDTEGAEDPEEAYQEHEEEADNGTGSVDAEVDRVPEGDDAEGSEGDIDTGADGADAYEEQEDFQEDEGEEGAAAAGEACTPHHANPSETSRTYSSVWANQKPGTGHARSQIDSKLAWCAKSRNGKYKDPKTKKWVPEWMQMPVPAGEEFAGIVTQGRKNYGQWVTKYKACKAKHVNPAENVRKYSSVWKNQKVGTGHAQSKLDSALAWCASAKFPKHSWVQMPVPKGEKLAGFTTQGRSQHAQWVTKYVVIYHDGKKWHYAGSYTGNKDKTSKVTHMLKTPVAANYMRIYPKAVHKHLCMRAGLVVCEAQAAAADAKATGPPGPTGVKGPTGPAGPPGPPGPPGPCTN